MIVITATKCANKKHYWEQNHNNTLSMLKFILGYSYKILKLYLKRKTYQEASSLITDR